MIPSPNTRRILPPHVAKDIADAWEIIDEMATRYADLRNQLAEAWAETDDIRNRGQLKRIRGLLASATAQVDQAMAMAALTPNERMREYARRRAERAEAIGRSERRKI